MSEAGPQKTPYNTRNAALAITLHALGVPWAKGDNGKPVGVFNCYTVDTLRGIETARKAAGKPALGLAGKSLEDGIRIAFKAGIPGDVEYLFERTPTLYAVLEGWEEQEKIIDAAGTESAKAGNLMVQPETAARIACQILKTRRDFFGGKNTPPLWQHVSPLAVKVDAKQSFADPREHRMGSTITGSYTANTVRV